NKATKADNQLVLEHGKPLLFANGRKGIRQRGMELEVVEVGEGGVPESELLVWDEKANSALAFLLAGMGPDFTTPIGVFRQVERPVYHELEAQQAQEVEKRLGAGDLAKLLAGKDTWTVK